MQEYRKPFPFHFKEIAQKEKDDITRLFKYPYIDLIRVEPKGYVVQRAYQEHAENIYNLPIRPDDLFVASYQRSGTTMTQELIWLLKNNLDYKTAKTVPVAHRYPFLEIFMYFDSWKKDTLRNIHKFENKEKLLKIIEVMSEPVTEKLAAMPSPRFVKTHLPMCLLPPNIVDTAKMVYIARDPRDVAVSSYHHAKLFKVLDFVGEFKDFWNIFRNDGYILTPFFEHLKEAWALRHHPNMLFIFYEEFKKDLPATIRRVAKFLGVELTTEQVAGVCEHLSVENFKNNEAVNYEFLREFGFFAPNETFIRQGKSNGWRDYFDEAMTLEAERWIQDHLRDTDLRFLTVKEQ